MELFNLEAEQSVLGSIILDKDAIDRVDLKAKDFYKEVHQIIFNTMLELHKNDNVIDIITLTEHLKRENKLEDVGGISYITSLSTIVPTTSNVKYYADIVKEKAQKRLIWTKANQLMKDIEKGESLDFALDKFERDTKNISDENEGAESINIILQEIFDDLENIVSGKDQSKILTGIPIIDKHTGGFTPGQLITIGAPSGQGKSSLTMAMLINILVGFTNRKNEQIIQDDKKILVITREMTKKEVVQRMLLSMSGIGNEQLKKNGITENEWMTIIDNMARLSETNLYVDQSSSTIYDIQRQVRKIKPDLLVIDYLQLLDPTDPKAARERQVADLSRQLKNMTSDLNMTIIQLTQLAEKGNGTTEIRPHGESFTRESRAIYMDSNIVIYLWEVQGKKYLENAIERNERIKEMAIDPNTEKPSVDKLQAHIKNMNDRGIMFMEIIVDKNRSGTKGSNYYLYDGKTMKYVPIG